MTFARMFIIERSHSLLHSVPRVDGQPALIYWAELALLHTLSSGGGKKRSSGGAGDLGLGPEAVWPRTQGSAKVSFFMNDFLTGLTQTQPELLGWGAGLFSGA